MEALLKAIPNMPDKLARDHNGMSLSHRNPSTDLDYTRLADYLAHLPTETDEVRLTFEQVEGILGRPLPVGAWHNRTWWAFPAERACRRRSMRGTRRAAAGWRVYLVDQHAGWVWFKRKRSPPDLESKAKLPGEQKQLG
jgi:hypothetical protein